MALYEFQIQEGKNWFPVNSLTEVEIAAAKKHMQDASEIYTMLQSSADINENFLDKLQEASDLFLGIQDAPNMVNSMVEEGQHVVTTNGFTYNMDKHFVLGIKTFIAAIMNEFGGDSPFIVYTDSTRNQFQRSQRTNIVVPQTGLQLDIERGEMEPMINKHTPQMDQYTLAEMSKLGLLKQDRTSSYGIEPQSISVQLRRIDKPWMNIEFHTRTLLREDGCKIQTITLNGNNGKPKCTNLLYEQIVSRWDQQQSE